MDKTRVGIIGCGNISGAYLGAGKQFEILDIVACADLDMDRARAKAAEFGVPRVCTVDELLADPGISIVANLTIPRAHAPVALQTLEAGKHAYCEKPFAVRRDEGQQVVDLAAARGLRVGCAPDTFLGGGIQTCRKLIDDGAIGEPIAVSANMMCHGHESWHPDPAFYYQPGGGPMFDMGPYYLTALVNLLGPVHSVSGAAKITFPERLITSEPLNGTHIKVEVPTHITGILNFASGVTGTITTSFDVWAARLPIIEIYGTEGTLAVPDPNGFGGPVILARPYEWQDQPLTHGYTDQCRSIGVADMAYALQSGRPHRASGELAFHVLDIMQSLHESSDQGKRLDLRTTCAQPAPLPLGLQPGTLDD
jgi:predicted dehydrogenase